MQRRAAEESLTDHGKDNSNGRAHVGDAIRHKPGILGFLRQIGFMGATTFATVRLRTVKTKGCLSRKTALAMAFKLILSARRKWRKLDGSNQLAELVEGVPFKDGIKITKHAA